MPDRNPKIVSLSAKGPLDRAMKTQNEVPKPISHAYHTAYITAYHIANDGSNGGCTVTGCTDGPACERSRFGGSPGLLGRPSCDERWLEACEATEVSESAFAEMRASCPLTALCSMTKYRKV